MLAGALYSVIVLTTSIGVHSQRFQNIVTVGDSFSSGNGARDEFGNSNYAGITGCYRSPTSWGAQIAKNLNATVYINRACSGAKIDDIQFDKVLDTAAKIGGICPTSSFSPEEFYTDNGGFCSRTIAAQQNVIDQSTDLVLFSTGGNDFQFSNLVRKCFVFGQRGARACQDAIDFVKNYISTYEQKLTDTLILISKRLRNDAKVVVVPYPHIVLNVPFIFEEIFGSGEIEITNQMRNLGGLIEQSQERAVLAANNQIVGGLPDVIFFNGTKSLFETHEPHPSFFNDNPNRWIWETDAPLDVEFYQLNPIGHFQLAAQLAREIKTYVLTTNKPTSKPTFKPTIKPTSKPTTKPANIVTVGDSFSSGNGARDEFQNANYAGISGCFRSPTTWGAQIANNLCAGVYINRACSGGQLSDIQFDRVLDTAAKIDGKCPNASFPPEEFYTDNGDFCSRTIAAQQNIIDQSTDLVLFSTGGNDFQFPNLVRKCFVFGQRSARSCQNAIDFANNHISTYEVKLKDILILITKRLRNDAKVIVVPYPHIALNVPFIFEEIFGSGKIEITNQMRNLGDRIEQAQARSVIAANLIIGAGPDVIFFNGTKPLFETHEPHPSFFTQNPSRWIWETDASIQEEFYHLNDIGHSQLAIRLTSEVKPYVSSTCTFKPTSKPSIKPSTKPSTKPSLKPTSKPTLKPTRKPTSKPTNKPTSKPTTIILTPSSISTQQPSPTTCFSGDNMVEMKDIGYIPMRELRIGDFVQSGNDQYSQIYGFGHFDHDQEGIYLRFLFDTISNDNKMNHISQNVVSSSLEISPSHLVFVDNNNTNSNNIQQSFIRAAGDVVVGDILSGKRIISIETVVRYGVYAPLTQSGDIIVNGILASNYVNVITVTDYDYYQLLPSFNQHAWGHFIFTPQRWFCYYNIETCKKEIYIDGYGIIAYLIISMSSMIDWISKLFFSI